MGMMSQVKHGLSADVEVRIFEQLLHLGQHGLVGRGIQDGKCFLPDVSVRVAQQAAHHGMLDALALHLKQAQCVKYLSRIGCRDLSRQ